MFKNINKILITLTFILILSSCSNSQKYTKTDLDLVKEEAYQYIDNLSNIQDIDKNLAKGSIDLANDESEINEVIDKYDAMDTHKSNLIKTEDPQELAEFKEETLNFIETELTDVKWRGELIRYTKDLDNIQSIKDKFAMYDELEDLERYLNE